MGDLARHQELQRVLRPDIVAEIDQPFIHDLRARLGGDVAAQIDVQLAGDLEIVGSPRIALRVEQIDASPAGDGDQGIGFRGVAGELRRLQMHPRERADDLEMAQFFGADIHQEILSVRIVAVETLDGILHGSGQLAIGAAELFEQHVAEAGVRLVHANGEHQFLHMVIHDGPAGMMMSGAFSTGRRQVNGRRGINVPRRRRVHQARVGTAPRSADAAIGRAGTCGTRHRPRMSPAAFKADVMTSLMSMGENGGTRPVARSVVGLLIQHLAFEHFGLRQCRSGSAEGLAIRGDRRALPILPRGLARPGLGEAEELGDVIGRRNPDLEEERSGSAAFLLRLAGCDRRAVRHVRDGIGFDQLIAGPVDPDLARITIDHQFNRRRFRQRVNIRPLFEDLARVRRDHRLVGAAMPHRNPGPWSIMPNRATHEIAPRLRGRAGTSRHALQSLLHIRRGAVRQSANDRACGEHLGVTSKHDRGHRRSRRQSRDEDAPPIDALFDDDLLDHLSDGQRFSLAPLDIAEFEPIEAAGGVIGPLLLGKQQDEAVAVGERRPPCSMIVVCRGLRAPVQHNDERRIGGKPRRRVAPHPQIARV